MASQFEMLVREMAAENQSRPAAVMLKAVELAPPVPVEPRRSAAQIEADRRQAFERGANGVMAKAMTAFNEKKIPGEAVNRLLARIHLTADRLFK